MHTVRFLLTLAVLVFLARHAAGQDFSCDFEGQDPDTVPSGWFVPTAGFRAAISDANAPQGKACALLTCEGEGRSFGNLMMTTDGAPFRGMVVRCSATIRVRATPSSKATAQMWLRGDREDGNPGAFDNMADRPIQAGAEWATYTIELPMEQKTSEIALGIFMTGATPGDSVQIDDVKLEIIGAAAPPPPPSRPPFDPPMQLSARQLDNVVAGAKLGGYICFFHPSDRVADLDWDAAFVDLMRAIFDAPDGEALAERLSEWAKLIAPAVEVRSTPFTQPPVETQEDGVDILWQHTGIVYVAGQANTIYRSQRTTLGPDWRADADGESITRETFEACLPAGVFARIPLVVRTAEPPSLGGPRRKMPIFNTSHELRHSGDDRSVRLAGVALAWNVLRHSYPYFDVTPGGIEQWEAQLRISLAEAAVAPDAGAQTVVLQRLSAALHDGHATVRGPMADTPNTLPFAAAWTGRERDVLAIASISDADAAWGLHIGDVLLDVDGKTPADMLAAASVTISAASPQWLRRRFLSQFGWYPPDCRHVAVRGRAADGSEFELSVPLVSADRHVAFNDNRPPNGALVGPSDLGIMYVDLELMTDDWLAGAFPSLLSAKAIIFDARGYPNGSTTTLLAHLASTPVDSQQWLVPTIRVPDQLGGLQFVESHWTIRPISPRLTAAAYFLTDGRAISFAETCLAIVHRYNLGIIIGEPTAGTNGNVNSIDLPGGAGEYSMRFTGMKVLNHDGSRFHGVGIAPAIPAWPTPEGLAAGRDEVLEAAIHAIASADAAEQR